MRVLSLSEEELKRTFEPHAWPDAPSPFQRGSAAALPARRDVSPVRHRGSQLQPPAALSLAPSSPSSISRNIFVTVHKTAIL